MKVLVTGACGFVGSHLALALREAGHAVVGLDNLSRAGSEMNRPRLATSGVVLHHGDVRCRSDFEALPACDFVIEAAAEPSVLAGLDTGARRLVEQNLGGTVNTLEYCRRHGAGLVLLSTSRVYSVRALNEIPLAEREDRFILAADGPRPAGVSDHGIDESFPTTAPVSLYGATKLASETLALEYGEAFDLPVWINRCGVIAGPGQFGHAAQGIVSFWIHAWRAGRPLRYIGFGGAGRQVRDILAPVDLARLVLAELDASDAEGSRILHVSGGPDQAISLAEVSRFCTDRFGTGQVTAADEDRPFDAPWIVLDHRRASDRFGWTPDIGVATILEAIADFADAQPAWLDRVAP